MEGKGRGKAVWEDRLPRAQEHGSLRQTDLRAPRRRGQDTRPGPDVGAHQQGSRSTWPALETQR